MPPVRPPAGSDWPRLAALAAVTLAGVILCVLFAVPFIPGLTWAFALAVVGFPLHRLVSRVVPREDLAAVVTTIVIIVGIAGPVVWVGGRIAGEAARMAELAQDPAVGEKFRGLVASAPSRVGMDFTPDAAAVEAEARGLARRLADGALGAAGAVAGGALQALVAVFVLFYSLRDRHRLVAEVERLVPLAPGATRRVLDRAEGAVYATVYGTLFTSALQGVTGGLMFYLLGLPAPILWGAVMFVLGILPVLGAFLIWVPAAVFLVTDDRWGAAVALVVWGLVMAGPVSNFVYARVAGDRMKLHPVPTLIAFIGGLAVVGVSGMVLGPCVLAVTVALIDAWHDREPDGSPADLRAGPNGRPRATEPAASPS